MIAVAVFLLVVVFPPGISISPADGAAEIVPENSYLEVTTSRWGASISSVKVTRVAVAPDGTKVDKRQLDGHLIDGQYVLEDGSNPLTTDAEYTVTVDGTVKEFSLSGISDKHVTQTQTFATVTTPMPVLTAEGVYVRYGEEAVIDWNIPLSNFEYQLAGIRSTGRINADDTSLMNISLERFEQGKEYALTITAATSENGMKLQQPVNTRVVTAPPLTVQFEPADGTTGASTQAHPMLVFSEPVSNPDLVSTLVSIQPQIAGSFQWTEPNRLEFVPTASWDYLQDVTITLTGGPSMLRAVGGGYVETNLQSTFTTAPLKMIEVDISDQTLTLYENGVAVDTHLVSTGLSGTATPLGDYTIYAKLSKTDMRGPGYFAPAVPWVMVFKGDYTIHGNYWATAFGQRSSHGCVGLPVDVAKEVYDWTTIGTPVSIHE